MARVCLIGSFPPAVTGGQAQVNESFRRMAEQAGADVNTIDLSRRPGHATLRRRSTRIPRVLAGIGSLAFVLTRRGADTVYVSVEGGYGQLYNIVFVSLIRLSRVPLFLHHDSYAYLQKHQPLTAVLVRVAGSSTTHIVLCDDMKERLVALYGPALRVFVVSNSTNIELPTHEPRARTRLETIGFISQLTRSKGVLEFLDVAERLHSVRPNVRALLAGPIEEPSLRAAIEQRVARASWINYLGPIYGKTKSSFYARIDALVFPTRLKDEADPRVINEALAHGVAVVARGLGCIGSVVGKGGMVIGEGTDFVDEAGRVLLEWYQDPALFTAISSGALAKSARLQAEHRPRLIALIRQLVSMPGPPASPTAPTSRTD